MTQLLLPDSARASDKQTTPSKRYIIPAEMIQLIGLEQFARLLREAFEHAASAPFELSRAGGTLRFRGPINEKGATAFEQELGRESAQELRITSHGGDIDAGLRIGRLLHGHGLHVVVDG